jgi:tetratricopeptide (TPR) repeat protein
MGDRPNPYVIDAPVDGRLFYGREKLIHVVRDTLSIHSSNLLVLYGPRGVGKTSLLHNLGSQEALDDFVFVCNDSADLCGRPAYTVLHHLGGEIGRSLGLPAPPGDQLRAVESAFRQEFLPQVYEKLEGKRLVLVFDDFDVLERRARSEAPERAGGEGTALDVLETLISEEADLAFILALGRGARANPAGAARFTRAGQWAEVACLEEEDARRLVVEPALGRLSYRPEAVDAILELAAGHPYGTQLVCYEIFNLLGGEGDQPVRAADVERAAGRALQTGGDNFGRLWEDLTPAQRVVASLMAEAAEDGPDDLVTEARLAAAFERHHIHRRGRELAEAQRQLEDLGVIRGQGPRAYRYPVEIVRRWIGRNYPPPQARQENLALLSGRAAAEYEEGRTASQADEAEAHYQKALAANPNHVAAQLALARTLVVLKRLPEAVEAYQAAGWLDTSEEVSAELEAAQAALKAEPRYPILRRLPAGRLSMAAVLAVVLLAAAFFVGGRLLAGGGTSPTPSRSAVGSSEPIVSLATQPPGRVPGLAPTTSQTASPARAGAATATATPRRVTPTPAPTSTSPATATLAPTATPAATATPTATATPAATATSSPATATSTPVSPEASLALEYAAPRILGPEDETRFPASEDVVLEWSPVGDLADNERYVVRLIFQENGIPTWDGDQVRTERWILPRDYLGRPDGPDFKFTWFVYVERVDANGETYAVSPESQHRGFYWHP